MQIVPFLFPITPLYFSDISVLLPFGYRNRFLSFSLLYCDNKNSCFVLQTGGDIVGRKVNFAAVFVVLILFVAITGSAAYAASNDVKLIINDEEVSSDVMPFIESRRTFVPARAVFESLGGIVDWDPDNHIVTVEYENTVVILKINDTAATVNGEKKTLDVPATIKNRRTVIPVRFVAEELGFIVGWADDSRTVTISSSKEPVESPAITGYVTKISVEEGTSKQENTIVTLHLSEPIKRDGDYSTMTLNAPNRFALDLKGFQMDSGLSDLTYNEKDSPLTAVRVADFTENTVRVVCDLKELTTPSVSVSEDRTTITISFRTLTTYFEPMDDGKLVVMLDPGHGESTAGKRSPCGSLREYEFNRAVAYRMKSLLEAEGIEVLLTVEDDSDPSLADRCELANSSDADIFVSIHANASGNGRDWTSPNGWEVYHYPGSVLGNRLATAISQSNFPRLGIHNRGIKTANFYVIKNTYMPAVLIEHGFFTNIEEIELLKSDAWRDKVAQYNVEGILNFFAPYL